MKLTGQKNNGIVLVNKDRSLTSHDLVYKMRKLLGMKRIGHTGTLDPEVDGLVILCLGYGTRVAEYLLEADKTYEGIIELGTSTTTQDASGEVLKSSTYVPKLEEITSVKNKFIGPIEQIPPMYSALKYKGQKLYDLARKGIEVERKSREVNIYNLDLFDYAYPNMSFKVDCSKGTYVRTLANDIGEYLGSFAHLKSMTRTRLAGFSLDDTYAIDQLTSLYEKGDTSFILDIEEGLKNFTKINLDDKYFQKLINGSKITVDIEPSDEIFRVHCRDEFIGLAKVKEIEGEFKLAFEKMLYYGG